MSTTYAANAMLLKKAINDVLWDDEARMYRDNEFSSLHPQDGNSMAILFNVTQSQEQNKAVSKGLTQFWTDIGSLSPELNDTIIPFVGGFEVACSYLYSVIMTDFHSGSGTFHRRRRQARD